MADNNVEDHVVEEQTELEPVDVEEKPEEPKEEEPKEEKEEETPQEPTPSEDQTAEVQPPEGAVGGVTEAPPPPKHGRFRSTKPDEGVDLLMSDKGLSSIPAETLPQHFEESVARNPGAVAMRVKRNDRYLSFTYQQYRDTVMASAKSLLKVGLEKFHGVGILGFNSPEWFFGGMGSIYAGGCCVGIYTTNTAEACQYILTNCKANVCIVENQRQLDKIMQVWERLPNLKAIVQYTGELAQKCENVYTWEEFLELGKETPDQVVNDIVKSQSPEECAVMVYTSGTTGPPKGVLLSHDNVVWTAKSLYATFPDLLANVVKDPTVVSYLPLSHIAALIVDFVSPLTTNGCVYFAQPDALKGTLRITLREARPTLFFGVPRVWEKMMDGMREAGASITGFKRTLATWAKGVALEGNQKKQKNMSVPWGWTIANILLRKAHDALGLNRCVLCVSGAAPITVETLDYFSSVNLPVMEVYGMSENSGPSTVTRPGHWRSGTVGKSLMGMEIKIDNPDQNGDGEILMRGRHVFMGYMDMEEKTRETIDDDRWLHTGDIGRLDHEDFLTITGRIKELIITAGGENIPPVPIENTIKTNVPFLSNVMVIGDKRKYLTCIATLKCVMDIETGAPTDDLMQETKQALAALGAEYSKVSEVVAAKNEKIHEAIMAGINSYNENQAVSRAQKVQKYFLLDTDFSIPGEELGPTLKLKRHTVVKKYAQQIESMYEE